MMRPRTFQKYIQIKDKISYFLVVPSNYTQRTECDVVPQVEEIWSTTANFTRTCPNSGLAFGTSTEFSGPYLCLP